METSNRVSRTGHSTDQGNKHPFPTAPVAPNSQALARHFLSRLQRLVLLRQTEAERLTDQGIHLLDLTIYSSLCDCIDAGAGEVARAILQTIATPEEQRTSLVETSPVGPRVG
jgi:hypothetical protein